jgi:preprotein translocase subunit SecF
LAEEQNPIDGGGATKVPPPAARSTKKLPNWEVVAVVVSVLALAGSIYFNLDAKITRAQERDDGKIVEAEKQQKANLDKLEQRLRAVEDGQRAIAALCRSFGELEEDRFQVQCTKEGGHYDFRALVCEKKDGTAERFHRLCS